jgi:hypothetical protein
VQPYSEEVRRADGVPDLRESQRGKGAAVEVVPLSKAARSQVNNPKAVELELAAIKVKALTKGGGRVYVMGPNAADLAKAVTALGGAGYKLSSVETHSLKAPGSVTQPLLLTCDLLVM